MTHGVYETRLKCCTFKLREKPSIYCYFYSNNMFIVVVFISTLVQFTLCPTCPLYLRFSQPVEGKGARRAIARSTKVGS